MPRFKELHCERPEEFISALTPSAGAFYRPYGKSWWIFRGHGDANYPLLPSGLRRPKDGKRSFLRPAEVMLYPELEVHDELDRIRRFFDKADSIGLPLPEDSQDLRSLFEGWWSKLPPLWPPQKVLSLMALAQHHGLPTRLLDWSRNPLKAAYFAAGGASAKRYQSGRLCVWALMLNPNPSASWPVTLVTAPAAGNQNLHAQEGVFTLSHQIETFSKITNEYLPLEKLIEARDVDGPPGDVWLWKVTLPGANARELLWQLAEWGVTREKLFPSYYGVVDAMWEERLMDIPGRSSDFP